jgi:hypothetical protein
MPYSPRQMRYIRSGGNYGRRMRSNQKLKVVHVLNILLQLPLFVMQQLKRLT